MTREEIKSLPEHRVKDATREAALEHDGFVAFTQYLRPNGEKRPGGFMRPPEVAREAARFIAAGGSFAAEVLPGGSVALSADFPQSDGEREDIAMLIVAIGPGLERTVDKLIARAVEWVKINAPGAISS